MNKRTFLIAAIIVVLFQSLAIAGMIVTHNAKLTSGREVVIRSGFVDPRSLFRGHYVIINLLPGDLTKSKLASDRKFKSGEIVYVELEKPGPLYWEARRLWHKRPDDITNPVIKGTMLYDPKDVTQSYRIRFPINRYFAARDRAKALEKIRRDQKLGVVLSLDENGVGVIKGLMIDGELVYDESVF